jgi:hypothetical protein
MPDIEKSFDLSVTSVLKFPLLMEATQEETSLERTVYYIFESIGLDASPTEKSNVSFDFYDWQITVKIRSSQLLSDSDSATAEFCWDIEAMISHPSEMEITSDVILQEINWEVTPNTVWDDEIEVSSIALEIL